MKNILWLSALVALVSGIALADGPETGVVTGVVTDAEQAPMPGVSVTITGDRGEKFTQTEANGEYRFALLPPGSYVVSAMLEGLGEAESNVSVTAGNRSEINLALASMEEETITVTSEAPLVDKFNVKAGQTMQSEVGVEVTGEDRTYFGVINFMPGTSNEDENADLASHRPNINGATWADHNVYIDGVDTTYTRYGGTRVYLPSAATTEVTLESGGMSADYGRTVGAATNVIVKSGTNKFHGDFGYSATRESWNSEFKNQPAISNRRSNPQPEDFFVRTAEERASNENNYETGLGGPLARDKAWFFISANQQKGNRTGKTINGDFVDESGNYESRIAKFNFQAGTNHAVAFSYIDTPILRNFRFESVFDRYAMTPHDISGDLFSGSWNWSISNTLFMETKLAAQTSNENKLLAFGGLDPDEATRIKQMDPRFPAGDPMVVGPDYPGNSFRPYIDSDGWHNGWLLDNGFGTNRFPRDQFNLAFTHFAGQSHELKYGFDGQQVEWNGDVRRLNLYSGQGENRFDALSRSGYSNPNSLSPFGVPCDFSTGDSCIIQDYNTEELLNDLGSNDTQSSNLALYVRDRFTSGDHWVFNVGVRAEQQEHRNDIDRVVMDSTDLSPRFSMAYDIKADGRQLVTFYAGRSYHQLPQQAINEYMQDQFNGYNGYERRLWFNCAFIACAPVPLDIDLGYTFSLGVINPGLQWDLVDEGIIPWVGLDPYHKNEIIAGYEWQVSRNWAFDAKLLWWEVNNLISSTTQLAEFNGRVDVFSLTANTDQIQSIMQAIYDNAAASSALCAGMPCETFLAQPGAIAQYTEPYRDYGAIQLQMNKRFSDGWGLYSNMTFAETGGSSHGSVFNNTNDTYGENLDQVMTEADIVNCQANQVFRTVPVDCVADWTQYLGVPLSLINRDGAPAFDRTVIAKATGWKLFNITSRQTFTLGGHFTWNTGRKWQRGEGAGGTDINPALSGIPLGLGVGVPVGTRGARELDAYWWMNLSGAYGFPLGGRVTGEFRLEIQNVTNNQDQIGITGAGEARALRRAFQRPRRFRALMGIRF